MTGEGWAVIMGGGSAFQDMKNPKVMIQAGAPGSSGILEISDIVFATKGPGERHRMSLTDGMLIGAQSAWCDCHRMERELPNARRSRNVGLACSTRRR